MAERLTHILALRPGWRNASTIDAPTTDDLECEVVLAVAITPTPTPPAMDRSDLERHPRWASAQGVNRDLSLIKTIN